MNEKISFVSILPLVLFVGTFIGCGIYYQDFYAIPSPIAVIIGIISAFVLFRSTFNEKVSTFIAGLGNSNILTMCVIYLLAGAFATLSKDLGCVDVIVELSVQCIPIQYIPLGIFIIASFISLASGTSVGTIVTIAPIAFGFSQNYELNHSFVAASLLGGAMFGDNLSMISDTTIAATQSLGCSMKDKFYENLKFAIPAALLTCVFYLYLSEPVEYQLVEYDYSIVNYWFVLPYLLVILLALLGIHVFLVLIIGVLATAFLGIFFSDLNFLTLSTSIYKGFSDMNEIFLLSLLTGGLAAMIEAAGGVQYILNKIQKVIKGKKSAMFGIGGLVSLVDIATANNTIAIIISSKIANVIKEEYKLSARLTAAILDIFSCVFQGILPYGAQVLLLIGLSNQLVAYDTLISYTYYPFLLLFIVIVWLLIVPRKRLSTNDLHINK
ncbi:Na+/H+ antiporter NhaC family protein [Capnocytophaga sp. ARDL2]|uniref:Na+/H+ antiporter NhaC family protein n=1 Tax=Capnocytophaga sp. ARDL2 TaxID=3238809 RepID=UPI0035563B5F